MPTDIDAVPRIEVVCDPKLEIGDNFDNSRASRAGTGDLHRVLATHRNRRETLVHGI